MQTFLPWPNIKESVKALDNRRLGKQRVEAFQILKIIDGTIPNARWRNHPAVKMWVGCREMLALYHDECIFEWIRRGFKNNMELKFPNKAKIVPPWWFGDESFHRAHRARLIEKDETFYLPKFPNDKGFNCSKYFWPVNETKTFRII